MYQYDSIDQRLVDERVAQFRDQTRRYLAGELSEEDFRPLRLRNGLYVQRFAPMLRIAIPYGLLNSTQLRMLGSIARRYDRSYGHFTTRQNLQLNWPKLAEVPDILADLATVQMHAIQTSGNCVRNVTSDHLAGVAADEIEDPRPYCELLRQWSTFHPEFTYLPRKFKIAVSGAAADRAATEVHDVGLHLVRNAQGELGFEVLVGGGLGRTPILGPGDSRLPGDGRSVHLHRGDPAGLQPPRPTRQYSQGPDQDPGQGARDCHIPRAGSKPNGWPRANSARSSRRRR